MFLHFLNLNELLCERPLPGVLLNRRAHLETLLADLPLEELHCGDAAGGPLGALQHGRLAPRPVHQDRVEEARVERPVHHVHLKPPTEQPCMYPHLINLL